MNTKKSEQKFKEFRDASFQSQRIFREVNGKINATAEKIFPLLCSIKEADWLPGSNHKLIYSESGYAETEYVFQSDSFGYGLETWVRYEHNANKSLAYIRTSENLVIKFQIILEENPDQTTNMYVKFTFTSLNDQGNNMLTEIPEELPFNEIIEALDYYIVNGRQINKN